MYDEVYDEGVTEGFGGEGERFDDVFNTFFDVVADDMLPQRRMEGRVKDG